MTLLAMSYFENESPSLFINGTKYYENSLCTSNMNLTIIAKCKQHTI